MNSRFVALILVIFASLFFVQCQRPMVVGDADKALLLQASALVPYGYGFQRIAQHETFKKSRDFDGTIELEYEFETPDSEVEDSLYMDVVVTVSRKKSDAKVSHGAEKIGVFAGLKLHGIVQEEKPDFYKYGDASSFFILKKHGKPWRKIFKLSPTLCRQTDTGLIKIFPAGPRRVVSVDQLESGQRPGFVNFASIYSFTKTKHGNGLQGYVDPRLAGPN